MGLLKHSLKQCLSLNMKTIFRFPSNSKGLRTQTNGQLDFHFVSTTSFLVVFSHSGNYLPVNELQNCESLTFSIQVSLIKLCVFLKEGKQTQNDWITLRMFTVWDSLGIHHCNRSFSSYHLLSTTFNKTLMTCF